MTQLRIVVAGMAAITVGTTHREVRCGEQLLYRVSYLLTADDATGFAGGATFGISAVAGNPNVSGASVTSNTAVSKDDGGCDCALVRRRLDGISGLMGLFGVLLGAVWCRRVACPSKT